MNILILLMLASPLAANAAFQDAKIRMKVRIDEVCGITLKKPRKESYAPERMTIWIGPELLQGHVQININNSTSVGAPSFKVGRGDCVRFAKQPLFDIELRIDPEENSAKIFIYGNVDGEPNKKQNIVQIVLDEKMLKSRNCKTGKYQCAWIGEGTDRHQTLILTSDEFVTKLTLHDFGTIK